MGGRGKLLALGAATVLASSVGGCAEARQDAGIGMVIGGVVLGSYGAATAPDRCAVPRDSPPSACNSENTIRGEPTKGIPVLMAGGVLAIAGAILILTADTHASSGSIK